LSEGEAVGCATIVHERLPPEFDNFELVELSIGWFGDDHLLLWQGIPDFSPERAAFVVRDGRGTPFVSELPTKEADLLVLVVEIAQ
jgi:hypothetical protein